MHLKSALCYLVFMSAISAQTTVTVSTPVELLNAIGPNKTIYLNAGDYDLSSATGAGSSYVTWEDEYDGSQIHISGVSNMKIIGKGNARVLVTPQYTWVMKFSRCQNITLDNYTMGHVAGSNCIGGVVYMDSCKNMQVLNCRMFGSGTYGMMIERTENVTVEKCDIYKCTYGLLQLYESKQIYFIKTRFRETGEFDLVTINRCNDIHFKTCVFEKNFTGGDYSTYYFFNIDNAYDGYMGSYNVTINTSVFRDNNAYYFSYDPYSVLKIGDNRFERNYFTPPTPTTHPIVSIYMVHADSSNYYRY